MASHSKKFIEAVWKKGRIVRGSVSKMWRKDHCGAWIKRNEYGNRKSKFGWEIDRIKTDLRGGDYIISNCRPMQWENNINKSGGNLVCKLTAKRGGERRANVYIK